jgi:hypothetical protein
MGGKVRIGISGWRYEPWRGVFYPEGLAQHLELEYSSRQFPTIEINGTFYSLQRPQCFSAWYAATPPGFVFAVKGSRYITHMKRLREVERPLANFLASGLFLLREKTGSLYPGIALHCANNSIAFGVSQHWGWQIGVLFLAAATAIWVVAIAVRVRWPSPATSAAG